MFLPPKIKTIGCCSLISLLLLTGSVSGQQADFTRRMEAMQQARLRAQQPANSEYSNSGQRVADLASLPAMEQPVARTASRTTRTLLGQDQQISSQPRSSIPARFNRAASSYLPQQTRTAQLIDGTMEDMGSPIVDSTVPGTVIEGEFIEGQYIEGEYIEGDYVDGGCSTCGDAGGYFEDSCCGRGGCAPGPCWLTGFGEILRKGEYFGGATAFRSDLFLAPGGRNSSLTSDPSHGFYQGFNLGVPLCRLTCGFLSGQFGARWTQSNFNGSENTTEDRKQVFVTAGLYRRVDYGLQSGLVVDYLRDDWFAPNVEVTQIRGDLGWVYPSGSTLGFRFASSVDESVNSGIYAGNAFTDMVSRTNDNYRFYYRYEPQQGGYYDGYLGWSDSQQTVVGLDFDLPVRDRMAMQAGFVYYLNDDEVPDNSGFEGGYVGEAYNFYVGFVFRPQGRSTYRSYDRPLLPVADNGSMLLER